MDTEEKKLEIFKPHLSDQRFCDLLMELLDEVEKTKVNVLGSCLKDNFFNETLDLLISKGGCIAIRDIRLRLQSIIEKCQTL